MPKTSCPPPLEPWTPFEVIPFIFGAGGTVVSTEANKAAAQEWNYAHEGMDMDSLCPNCFGVEAELQVLSA